MVVSIVIDCHLRHYCEWPRIPWHNQLRYCAVSWHSCEILWYVQRFRGTLSWGLVIADHCDHFCSTYTSVYINILIGIDSRSYTLRCPSANDFAICIERPVRSSWKRYILLMSNIEEGRSQISLSLSVCVSMSLWMSIHIKPWLRVPRIGLKDILHCVCVCRSLLWNKSLLVY